MTNPPNTCKGIVWEAMEYFRTHGRGLIGAGYDGLHTPCWTEPGRPCLAGGCRGLRKHSTVAMDHPQFDPRFPSCMYQSSGTLSNFRSVPHPAVPPAFKYSTPRPDRRDAEGRTSDALRCVFEEKCAVFRALLQSETALHSSPDEVRSGSRPVDMVDFARDKGECKSEGLGMWKAIHG